MSDSLQTVARAHLLSCLCYSRRERPKATAARECYEETLGVLGDKQTLVDMLVNYEGNNIFKVWLEY